MDPISAIPTPEPEVTTTATLAPIGTTPWIERHVGECVAAAAVTILEALGEFQDRGLTSKTKASGGDRIFTLYRLHQYLTGRLDFDRVAREQGAAALRAACGTELSPATIDTLVDETLRILREVVRATVN